ncbi:MAG TPA: hypothetical protein VF719_12530 [Abditibacteriaceae bacterium]|jgi:hypothetical protein
MPTAILHFFALTLGSFLVMLSGVITFSHTAPPEMLGLAAVGLAIVALIGTLFGRSRGSTPFDDSLYSKKSIIGKSLRVWCGVATTYAVLLFFYGIVAYPSAPIRPAADGTYVSKRKGKLYTKAQYESFQRWEAALMTAWPGMMLMLVSSEKAVNRKKKRRSRKSTAEF